MDNPAFARIGPHLATARPDDLFEIGLGILLDGIETRLVEHARNGVALRSAGC